MRAIIWTCAVLVLAGISQGTSLNGRKNPIRLAQERNISTRDFYTTTSGNLYYMSNTVKKSFDEAFLFCTDIGMSLISIEFMAKHTDVVELTMARAGEGYWTSGKGNPAAATVADEYFWESNKAPFTNNEMQYWNAICPNQPFDESCVYYFTPAAGGDTEWYDSACTTPFLFICEEIGTTKS